MAQSLEATLSHLLTQRPAKSGRTQPELMAWENQNSKTFGTQSESNILLPKLEGRLDRSWRKNNVFDKYSNNHWKFWGFYRLSSVICWKNSNL
jgi:hypothetical protein